MGTRGSSCRTRTAIPRLYAISKWNVYTHAGCVHAAEPAARFSEFRQKGVAVGWVYCTVYYADPWCSNMDLWRHTRKREGRKPGYINVFQTFGGLWGP